MFYHCRLQLTTAIVKVPANFQLYRCEPVSHLAVYQTGSSNMQLHCALHVHTNCMHQQVKQKKQVLHQNL